MHKSGLLFMILAMDRSQLIVDISILIFKRLKTDKPTASCSSLLEGLCKAFLNSSKLQNFVSCKVS